MNLACISILSASPNTAAALFWGLLQPHLRASNWETWVAYFYPLNLWLCGNELNEQIMQNQMVFSNMLCLTTFCWHTWEDLTLEPRASWSNCYFAGDLWTATFQCFVIHAPTVSSGLWYVVARHLIHSVPGTKPSGYTLPSFADRTEPHQMPPETETALVPHHVYLTHLRRLNIFTATVWALSFSHNMHLWAHIIRD